jgi:hypothetical protein
MEADAVDRYGRPEFGRISMAEKSLEERLRELGMLERIERLVGVVEDAEGDVEKADEAERRLIEELRKMGSEALHAWAGRKSEQKAEDIRRTGGTEGHGKKNPGGAPHSG